MPKNAISLSWSATLVASDGVVVLHGQHNNFSICSNLCLESCQPAAPCRVIVAHFYVSFWYFLLLRRIFPFRASQFNVIGHVACPSPLQLTWLTLAPLECYVDRRMRRLSCHCGWDFHCSAYVATIICASLPHSQFYEFKYHERDLNQIGGQLLEEGWGVIHPYAKRKTMMISRIEKYGLIVLKT